MKKIYFLILSLTSTLSFSQQVLKKITDFPTYTLIEIFTLRNGNSNSNVVGNGSIDVGASTFSGVVNFHNADSGVDYVAYSNANISNPTISNLSICNGTFSPFFSYQSTQSDYTYTSNTSITVDISVLQNIRNYDSLEDSNNLVDLLYYSAQLPKLLNNGSLIPNNFWALIQSRKAVDLATGANMPGQKLLGFKFIGNTWIEQSIAWNGNLFDDCQNVCSSLSVSEIENLENKILVYPNPTNSIINITSPNEIIDQINIYDMFGRYLKSEKCKNMNEKIDIQVLPNALYLIEIQTENRTKTFKILKQ